MITINPSHLASASGRHPPPWEIPCPALTGIAQLDQADPGSTGARARLTPDPPCPPPPESRMPTATKLRCAARIRRMALASTETNASSLTALRICAMFPDTPNTRRTSAAPTTASGFVPTAPVATLCTPLTR